MKPLLALLVVTLALGSCAHVPPTLTPIGVPFWYANEAGNVVQQVESGVIGANAIGLPASIACVVVNAVEEGLPTLEASPSGWRATLTTILDTINTRLDSTGRERIVTILKLLSAFINGGFGTRDIPPQGVTDDQMKAVFASTVAHTHAAGRAWLATHSC